MKPLRPDDPRQLGGYRLLRRVGAGGMGVVFLGVAAEDHGGEDRGDDLAAVKAVRTEYAEDPEFRARFAGEVDLARRVRGPYTARVLAADTEGPRPWLATEYVAGPSLHKAVRESGPFPEDSLRALAAGLAKALASIHSVGLIHRDLKPSNVLLSPRGPQVIDFGIARATDATALTKTGQMLGTPAFMSPEQATGAHLGAKSDLFSFGGVLLFAGTGRQPFGTGDPAALLYRVVNEEPDLSGVPEGLRGLVAACLAKDAGDRPDLETIQADLSDVALPEVGAEDPTEWLPTAVATKVKGTMVATHVLPTKALPEEAGGEGAGDPATQEAGSGPARGTGENGEAGEPAKAPEDPGVEGAASTQEAEDSKSEEPATPPGTERAAKAGEADRGSAPGKTSGTTFGRPSPPSTKRPIRPAPSAPKAAAHSPTPDRHLPVPAPRSSSPLATWGITLSVLSLLVGLVVVLNLNGSDDAHSDAAADDSATEEGTSDGDREPPSSTEPEAEAAEIQELAFLDEDRFAVLSEAGVHLYETDRPEPTEELVSQTRSLSRLGRSKLVTDPNGTALAVQDGGSGREAASTVVVWDLEESEEHLVTLPETFGSGEPLALSPGGSTLFVGSGLVSGAGNEVTAFDTRGGEELYTIDLPEDQEGHQGSVQDLGTTPDGELLIGAVTNGLAVWDAATGAPVPGVPELREWSSSVSGPMAITDGLVATASYEQLLLWDPRSSAGPESFEMTADDPTYTPDTDPWITSLSIGEDGKTIVGAGHFSQQRGFLSVWNRAGEQTAERWSDTEQYRTVQAPPSGGGVLVAPYLLGDQDLSLLRLLDEDFRIVTEFEVPTVDS